MQIDETLLMVHNNHEAQLCTLIDSWSTSPIIFIPYPDPAKEPRRRAVTNGMFQRAILFYGILKSQTLEQLNLALRSAGNYTIWPNVMNLFDQADIDPIESRNGCELWQAFLIIIDLTFYVEKRFQSLKHNDTSSMFYTKMLDHCVSITFFARILATKCLIKRHHLPLPNPGDMRLVTQILYVEMDHSPFAVHCLNQAIRISSTTYDNLCNAKKIITDYLLHIEHTHILYYNITLLQEAEKYLQKAIHHVDQDIMALFKHTQGLPLELQEYTVDLMKNDLTPLDPPFQIRRH